MLSGVPAHVDGRMLEITEDGGRAASINPDRMWHYTEGIENWDPIWPLHGIRILPGPVVAVARRDRPAAARRRSSPASTRSARWSTSRTTGHDHSWFVLTQKIIEKEFALSGSEQNPDLTGKSVRAVLRRAWRKGAPAPVEAFKQHGEDFVVETDLRELVDGMNALTGDAAARPTRRSSTRSSPATARSTTRSPRTLQVTAIRGARNYLGDKLIRVAAPHRLLDPKAGPLIAVRLNILTRKTLGGLETDLAGPRARRPAASRCRACTRRARSAGFGGGGMHGYRSLEGTFLGGCLFSGRTAGRAVAAS